MRRCIKVLIPTVLVLLIGATASWATMLDQYLPGNVNITMKFSSYDEGRVYDTTGLALNTTYRLPTDPLYDGVHNLLSVPSVPGYPVGSPAGEDSWGIFRLDRIYDTDTQDDYWNNAWSASDSRWITTPFEITGMFWGEVDKSLTWDGSSQVLKGDDLHFAFFEDTARNFSRGDPAFRVGDTFPTVTDGALIWTGNSAGSTGDSAPYEFYSKFTPAGSAPFNNATGTGNFMGATGAVPTWGTGSLNWLLGEIEAGINLKFQYTADTDGRGNWLLSDNDPVKGVTTPELSSGVLMLLGLVPVGIGWRRRKTA